MPKAVLLLLVPCNFSKVWELDLITELTSQCCGQRDGILVLTMDLSTEGMARSVLCRESSPDSALGF